MHSKVSCRRVSVILYLCFLVSKSWFISYKRLFRPSCLEYFLLTAKLFTVRFHLLLVVIGTRSRNCLDSLGYTRKKFTACCTRISCACSSKFLVIFRKERMLVLLESTSLFIRIYSLLWSDVGLISKLDEAVQSSITAGLLTYSSSLWFVVGIVVLSVQKISALLVRTKVIITGFPSSNYRLLFLYRIIGSDWRIFISGEYLARYFRIKGWISCFCLLLTKAWNLYTFFKLFQIFRNVSLNLLDCGTCSIKSFLLTLFDSVFLMLTDWVLHHSTHRSSSILFD